MKIISFATLAAIAASLSSIHVPALAQGETPPSAASSDAPVNMAQSAIGVVLGINRDYHSGGFHVIPAPDCPVFERGSGWGFLAGLTAEFPLGKSWSLTPRIAYDSRPERFQQTLDKIPVLINDNQQNVQTTDETVSATSTITYALLNAEALCQFQFLKIGRGLRLAVAAGPAFGYVLAGKNRQIQELIDPPNARFIHQADFEESPDGRTIILFDGDIPARNALRFSLKGGLNATIAMFDQQWFLCPGIYYDYGLTGVTSQENWNLNALMFQIDFRHAL